MRLPIFSLALLLLASAPASAHHDGDPVQDVTEAFACGFPDVAFLLDALQGLAGTCDGLDYRNADVELSPTCSGSLCEATVRQESHAVGPYRLDVTVTIHYDESRLTPRASVGGLEELWEPVDLLDPAAVQWYAAHPDETAFVASWSLSDGGTVVDAGSRSVPYLGQVVAAQYAET